jgi:uncharacterized protein
MTFTLKFVCASSMILAMASPAFADSKKGVDAWERGDYAAAIKEWRPLAIKGDADSQFNLAQAYRFGRGTPVDMKMAEEWYRRAASQGHLQAEDNLALIMFQNGDRQNAMPLIQRSAGRGDPRAQYVLGTALFNGEYVQKDWPRAYGYMTRSSGAGLSRASAALAQMDQHIPLEQRQQGLAFARELEMRGGGRNTLAQAEPLPRPHMMPAAAPQPTPEYRPQVMPETYPQVEPEYRPQTTADATPSWSEPVHADMPIERAPSVREEPVQTSESQSTPSWRKGALPSPRKTSRSAKKTRGSSAPNTLPAAEPQLAGAGWEPQGNPGVSYPTDTGPNYPTQSYPAEPYPTESYPEPSYPVDQPVYQPPRPAPVKKTPVIVHRTTSPATSGWRVQLGAFSTPGKAESLWQSLKSKVSTLKGKTPYLVKSGAITRLQAGPFALQAAATQTCDAVRSSGYACLIVVP